MDQTNEPLASRLRDAAIERTTNESERVDDFVLDADGVIDLRELDRDRLGASVADPAKALASIRGRLGDAHEVADLYDESEPERPRWRLGLRARHAFGEVPSAPAPRPVPTPTPTEPATAPTTEAPTLAPLSRLSAVPLRNEVGSTDGSAPSDAEPEADDAPDTAVFSTGSIAESIGPEIDLRDEDRPTADCPKCMGLGHRDLFDRFSQVEFYSCDNCMHMWQQDLS